jgi:small subunit ribosomal protein S6
MKTYEGLFLIKPELEKEELSQLYQKIHDNIKRFDGQIDNAEEWGKRPLAYQINKYTDGIYYLLKIQIPASKIKGLGSDLKLDENILRMMFTQA